MPRSFWNALGCAGLLLTAICATAQPYPVKPVSVIVPSSAGGVLDLMARALSQRFAESLGQPFVIETRPGANGIIGAEFVAKSAPDGYALLFTTAGTISYNPFLYERLPYDAAKAFAPIAMCCVMVQAVVVSPSLKVNSVLELVGLAKSSPGRLAYGSNGGGSSSNIYMEALKRLAGIDVVHVPYKGSAPAVTDLIGGRVSMMVVTPSVIQGHLQSGKLKALAIGSPRRSSAFPDVPTAAESGFPGWDAEAWLGLFAPAGTPREIVAKLNAAMTRITGSEQFGEQWLKRYGLEPPHAGTAEQFAEFVRIDMQNSERLIRSTGIKLD
jgi:tripartite-type tricarboxylate transporter receptor subunit TctC